MNTWSKEIILFSKVVDFQASLKVSSRREADKFEANTNSKANIE